MSMDSPQIQHKVQAFAQRLLDEAQGDPVRALGLLVLVLDDTELESGEPAHRLMAEVRKVLLPDFLPEMPAEEDGRAVQHLAGERSWEGVQHCLRCGKSLSKRGGASEEALPSGYVYEIGSRLTADPSGEFDSCL